MTRTAFWNCETQRVELYTPPLPTYRLPPFEGFLFGFMLGSWAMIQLYLVLLALAAL